MGANGRAGEGVTALGSFRGLLAVTAGITARIVLQSGLV